MEIEDPKTAKFIPLEGALNFEHRRSTQGPLPDEFNFAIDWTKEGRGQEILREHISSRSLMRMRHLGKEYQGIFRHEWGFNTADGMVFVEVA